MSNAFSPGQMIVMGVPGPELTDGLRELIRRVQPGGFILFARNLASAEQVFHLNRELHALCDRPPVITIDQEGGRVSRLKQVGEEPVSGMMLCRAGREDWCREHGVLTGRLLHLLGFNLNLAPVVDFSVDEEVDNSLRGRCLGRNPAEVIRQAGAFLEGMQSEGVLGTAKHFPGYTFCALDPHGELPRIDRTREQLEAEELVAFRAFLDCPSFMVGHAHFPHWHREPFPASLSPEIVGGLLRGELGYRGLVMTDDLEMGAIANHYGSVEATRLAVEAGQDILLFCHNPACVQLAHEKLESMPREKTAPALGRIGEFRKKLIAPPAAYDAEAFAAVNRETAALREKVAAAIAG